MSHGGTLAITGNVSDDNGAESLTLNGDGTGQLVLSGSNTYGGPTTVSQGKLVVNGWLTNSSVSVNGGTLGGNGYLNSVTVYAGGTLAPGNAPGTLHLSGSLTLEAGAVLAYGLDTPSTSDAVSCGTLALNNQQFTDFRFMPTANFVPGSYDLIAFGSTSGSLGNDLSGTVGGYTATLSISNNDLVLTIVPEPSTATLLAVFALSLAGYGWRRRRTARTARPGPGEQAAPATLPFPSHATHQTGAARRAA